MTSEEAQRLAYKVRMACRAIATDGDRFDILTELDGVATELEKA